MIGETSHRLYIKVTPWRGKTCLYIIMFISEKYFKLYPAAVLKLYMEKASSGQQFGW